MIKNEGTPTYNVSASKKTENDSTIKKIYSFVKKNFKTIDYVATGISIVTMSAFSIAIWSSIPIITYFLNLSLFANIAIIVTSFLLIDLLNLIVIISIIAISILSAYTIKSFKKKPVKTHSSV